MTIRNQRFSILKQPLTQGALLILGMRVLLIGIFIGFSYTLFYWVGGDFSINNFIFLRSFFVCVLKCILPTFAFPILRVFVLPFLTLGNDLLIQKMNHDHAPTAGQMEEGSLGSVVAPFLRGETSSLPQQ
jgi:hypothetical protein